MDRGILAIWYDFPEEGKADYLAWLYDVHLPAILADREDFLWAAHFENAGHSERFKAVIGRMQRAEPSEVPPGTHYLLLFGAESPYAFFDPNVPQMRERWSAETKAMVQRRIGSNICVFAEEERVAGPAVDSRAPGITPGPYIQMGHYRMSASGDEHDLGGWYAQVRLPFAAQMPGSIGARKLVASAGWGKHAVLYEFVSAEVREGAFVSAEVREALDESSWTARVHKSLVHAPASPFVVPRLWPPVA